MAKRSSKKKVMGGNGKLAETCKNTKHVKTLGKRASKTIAVKG